MYGCFDAFDIDKISTLERKINQNPQDKVPHFAL